MAGDSPRFPSWPALHARGSWRATTPLPPDKQSETYGKGEQAADLETELGTFEPGVPKYAANTNIPENEQPNQ